MANSINTLQQLLIRDAANTTLQQYNDQLNRRLAALANLGQRYGQEGPGFYIETVTLAKLYDLYHDTGVGYVRVLATSGAYAGVELRGTDREELSGARYTVPSFMEGFFEEVVRAFTDVYGSHGTEYSEYYSESSVIPPDYFVELAADSAFHVVYDSSTNLPIRLAQPFQVFSSAAYVTDDGVPLFTAQFTVVANITEYEISGASVSTTFASAEYGLSVTEDGSVYFNGEPTEISLRGAAGHSTEFIEVTSNLWLDADDAVLRDVRFFSQYSAAGDSLDTDDFVILPVSGVYTDGEHQDVYAAAPKRDALLRNYNVALEPGAVLMSFASVLTSEYGTVDRVCSTIWIYESGDTWKPITSSSDSSRVLTFQDFISEDSLVRRVESDMEAYISGTTQNDSGGYFRFDTLRFVDSKTQVQNNPVGDNILYNGTSTLYTTLRKSVVETGGRTSILDVYFENSVNQTYTFQQELYANTGTAGVPGRKNTGDDYGLDAYSPELQLVHVKNAGLYRPSAVDEVRVYGVDEREFAGMSAASHSGVPYVSHNALGSFWKETSGPDTSTDIFRSYLEYDDHTVTGRSARYHVGTYSDSGWAGRLYGNLFSVRIDGNEETAEDPGDRYTGTADGYPDSVVLRNTQGLILTSDSAMVNSTVLSRHVLQMRRGTSSGFVYNRSSFDAPETWRDDIPTDVRVTPGGVTVEGVLTGDSGEEKRRTATLVSDGIRTSHDFSVYTTMSHKKHVRHVHAKMVCFIPKFYQDVNTRERKYKLGSRTDSLLGNQGYWYYSPQCPRYGIHIKSGDADIKELDTRVTLEYNGRAYTVSLAEAVNHGYIDPDDNLRWHTAGSGSDAVYIANKNPRGEVVYVPVTYGYRFLQKIYFPILNEEPAMTSQPDAMLPDLTQEINRRTFSLPPYPPSTE